MDWNRELLDAADKGDLRKVEMALENGADIETKKSSHGTSLMLACRNGDNEMAEFLLKAGADINAENEIGYNALTMVVTIFEREKIRTRKKMVKMLIEKGADIFPILLMNREYDAYQKSLGLHEIPVRLKRFMHDFIKENMGMFSDDERAIILAVFKPGTMPVTEKKRIMGALRKICRKKRIAKEQAKEVMEGMMKEWNEKTGELQKIEMKKPKRESNGERMRKSIR
ncbi:ankyrin repeat domain-containing protein [Candidatus Micrarchaeota archaeon]|nr:ankyrin repeat domain-containing protein [Candidatus Micrarchaeota archaeon]